MFSFFKKKPPAHACAAPRPRPIRPATRAAARACAAPTAAAVASPWAPVREPRPCASPAGRARCQRAAGRAPAQRHLCASGHPAPIAVPPVDAPAPARPASSRGGPAAPPSRAAAPPPSPTCRRSHPAARAHAPPVVRAPRPPPAAALAHATRHQPPAPVPGAPALRRCPTTGLPHTAPAPERKGWLDKLKLGLRKTGSSIATVFTGTKIDDALYEELETALLLADTGVKATRVPAGRPQAPGEGSQDHRPGRRQGPAGRRHHRTCWRRCRSPWSLANTGPP